MTRFTSRPDTHPARRCAVAAALPLIVTPLVFQGCGGSIAVEGRDGGSACATVDCSSPPEATCADGDTLRTYALRGTCDELSLECSYEPKDVACLDGCEDGACRAVACDSVICDEPPETTCANPLTLRTYESTGTCNGAGYCTYPSSEQSCSDGCVDGQCQDDPCVGVVCNAPKVPSCLDVTTLRSYESQGTCSGGQCSYTPVDVPCEFGCEAGACKVVPGLVPVAPFRFLDTRGGAKPAIDTPLCVAIAGQGEIPADAKAIVINLTAVATAGPGFMTAFPKGVAEPNASIINYVAAQTIANGAILKTGANGELCVTSHVAAAHIIVDVTGYFPADAAYEPKVPYRRMDTRSGTIPGSGAIRCVQIAGRDGVPATAKAVAVNLVAVAPTGGGFFTAYAKGSSKPSTSNLNYADTTIANGAIVKVGTDGEFCVYVKTQTHIVVDVYGYFADEASYVPVAPARVVNTQSSTKIAADSSRCFAVGGQGGVPQDARAVAVNLAAVVPSAAGHAILYPSGLAQPITSSLNYPVSTSRSNNALVQVGDDGKICIYSLSQSDYILDVVGYWPAISSGDPCADLSCTSPPPSTCVGGSSILSYEDTGTCVNGICSYPANTEMCPSWCSNSACEPTFGWDYNLSHRCVATPHPQGPNYYEDFNDCPTPGSAWRITNNSERSLGVQCSGIQNQSLPVNAGGPLTLNWQPHTDEFGRPNWIANLKNDVVNHAHPCGAGVYTFFGFMDHAYFGGGPFPKADRTIHRFRVKYDDWTPNGAARAIAFYAAEWNGKGVWLEIDLASKNWGDAYTSVADIIQVYQSSAFLWVEMYGPAMGYGVPRQTWTQMTIDWSAVMQNLIARGYLEAPSGGLGSAQTYGLGLATETHAYGTTGASAELWVTDFRIDDQ